MQKPDQPETPAPCVAAVPIWFLTLLSCAVLLSLLYFGRDFLVPLALAALLFILNMALIDRLDSAQIAGKSIPRWLAYIGATGLIFAAIAGIGYGISLQAIAFEEAAPRYVDRFSRLKGQIDTLIGPDAIASLDRAIQNADLQGWLTGFAASAGGVLGNVGLILLYLAFMLAERGAFSKKLPLLFSSKEDAEQVSGILTSISSGVRQYMWINTLTSAMSGLLSYAVLKLLGVDFAGALALSVFGLNFIPSIGSFLATLIPTLVALLQFDTLTPALLVVVIYGGGDAIIGNVIQPRLQGKSLNLSAFVVMIALTFWSMMWGGVGAFMAVPLTVVIMIICSEIPGLRPFARLLSSDGTLPSQNTAPSPSSEGTEAPLLPGKSLPPKEDMVG